MNSKTSFIQNKELAEWWAVISGDSRFDKVVSTLKGMAFEACPSEEQRKGVLFAIEALLTMNQPETDGPDFSRPGIKYDLDSKRRTLEQKPNK